VLNCAHFQSDKQTPHFLPPKVRYRFLPPDSSSIKFRFPITPHREYGVSIVPSFHAERCTTEGQTPPTNMSAVILQCVICGWSILMEDDCYSWTIQFRGGKCRHSLAILQVGKLDIGSFQLIQSSTGSMLEPRGGCLCYRSRPLPKSTAGQVHRTSKLRRSMGRPWLWISK
jgi:hypothetical protein